MKYILKFGLVLGAIVIALKGLALNLRCDPLPCPQGEASCIVPAVCVRHYNPEWILWAVVAFLLIVLAFFIRVRLAKNS